VTRSVPGAPRLVAAALGGVVISGLGAPAVAAVPVALRDTARQPPAVVLLAAPGLQWSDVAAMPALRALLGRGAVGELSVKTSGDVTRCAAGLLAVSAGNRTAAPASTGRGCTVELRQWPALAQRNLHTRYAARIGLLGSALRAAGIPRVVVGSAAGPMLADQAGATPRAVTGLGDALAAGGVTGMLDDALYDAVTSGRARARAALDTHIAAVTRLLPPSATMIVAGVSDGATGGPQLHPVVVAGPRWRHSELRSSGAGRAPYVQLIDIAPTILTAEGVPVPRAMAGRPMQQSSAAVRPVASYVEDNRHAVEERTLGQRTFLVVGIVAIVVMCLAGLPLPVLRSEARAAGHVLARLVAPAPLMMFVGNALPWWRWGQWTYAVTVAAGCLVLAALTTYAWRRNWWLSLVLTPAVAVAVLALDQLTGSTLQLSAPLGDNPLVAGRFKGMGNIDFAVFAASAMVLAGVLGGRLRRRHALPVAGGIALIALVIDGAPRLGNDLGGVVSLIPAALAVIAILARLRVSPARAVGGLVATAAVAVGIALADYSRPATSQTHVGRFVGQVLHGGAGTEVRRKVDAVVGSFGGTVGTVVAAVALGLAVMNYRRLRTAVTASPAVSAAVISTLVLGVVGTVLNDSGVTIAAVVTIVVFNALYGGRLPTASSPDEGHAAAGR
jgi:hypothetical protein